MAAGGAVVRFSHVFGRRTCVVIGMIHVDALPGTPRNTKGMSDIIQQACQEAAIYQKAGVDSVMLENMHDIPYLNRIVGPEITASMSVVCQEVKRKVQDMPCGVQILAGANKEALAVAKASSLDYIRAEGFVFSHVADEGIINSDAGELLRYRKQIDAENVLVFTDVKKKHSAHSITSDVDITDTAKAAEFFLSDGVIITGSSTGIPASLKELQLVKESVVIPVLVGSGVTYDNVETYLQANAIIVGSHFKQDNHWSKTVEYDKVKSFMAKVERLRR